MSISNITSIALTDLPPTITASAGAHGSITPDGDVLVAYDADKSFDIAPDPGCHVANVLVDGQSEGAVTSYTFHHVTDKHTISASFAVNLPVEVTSPNGGETAYIGESENITWSTTGVTGNVNIYISRNSGKSWTAISPRGGAPNTGSYSWLVTTPVTATARIKVASISMPIVFDTSDADFTISAGTITVDTPSNGDTWYVGESDNITWTSSHVPSNVNIYISRNGGLSWTAITPRGGVPNTSLYSWLVTTPVATQAKIKIARADIATVYATSDSFTISGGTITVDTPSNGDTWYIGESDNITWTSSHVPSKLNIYISRNGGLSWTAITPAGGVANTGTYAWLVKTPVTTAATAKIKIARADMATVYTTSDSFTISGGTITVDTPSNGDTWYIGESDNITWTSSHVPSNVNIYVSRNGGLSWTAITPAGGVANTGTYAWLVKTPVTTAATAKVKVARADMATVYGTGASFTISGGTITVTAPNGYETWHIGESDNITWTSDHVPGNVNVNIYISRNGGLSWTAITSRGGVPANTGTYSWLVTKPASTTAKVKVARTDITTVFDASDANFSIQ